MTIPAPAIEHMDVLQNNILKIKFEGFFSRYVDLKTFPLLGIAKSLLNNGKKLRDFVIVDGIPEWNGQCLLGPDELFKYSAKEIPSTFEAVSKKVLISALKRIVAKE